MNRLQLEALISSILIYLIIIVTIFSIALYSPKSEKSKTYVEKRSEVIEVSLGSPNKKSTYLKKNSKKTPKKSKKEKKKVIKKRKVVKKVRNIKAKKAPKKVKKVYKKATKQKTKTTSKSVKKTPKKNINASSLFKKLPNDIKSNTPQSSGKAGKSAKRVNQGKGVVNKYFAKVQSILKGWPAQNNFAGEKVRVELTIYSSGLFDYKILHRSLNPEFNRALKSYLEQLKRVGFGPHSNPKPYKIIVEFIAKG